jgi:nondiscriminating glutamyl-tRNA synthetase
MSEKIRVRFAPSPTGPLHIGGARSALFNWLFARGKGGKMVLRVEDTDVERSTRASEEEILESLSWLGMDWDEGVDVGGQKGPYRQRERLHIYNPYVDKLLKEGKAYYCFCREEELESERQEMLRAGEDMLGYSGRCRSLSEEEVNRRLAAGEKGAVRFHVPPGEQVVIADQVRGTVTFETDGIGDFIIIKSDGIPTYNFAVVIDDLEMEISHVIRAEEHLSNTPRQVLLYQALEVPVPVFAHISLILGEDRSKMSKRHGATSIVQYREMGYLPEALLNFLALLGGLPRGSRKFLLPTN